MKSYESLAANIAAIEKLGNWIHMSGMFGTKNSSQGMIIASELFITNQPLMDYQKRNDIVSGKPSKPYDAMLAEFQEAGGSIKVLEKSPDAARIELTYDGHTTPFAVVWEEFKKEPTPYHTTSDYPEAKVIEALAKGETPPLKAKYATPRSRAIMMFARVVSDGIRTVCPVVNFGTYTSEEIEDFAELQPVAGSAPSTAVIAPTPSTAAPVAAKVSDPPFVPNIPDKPSEEPAAVERNILVEAVQGGPSVESQKASILEAMAVLVQEGMIDVKDRVVGKLKASGIQGGILGLNYGEADSLLVALKSNTLDAWCESTLKGHAPKA